MPIVKIEVYKPREFHVLLGGPKGVAPSTRWRVVWTRKPPKRDKGITGFMSKNRAQKVADTLNKLPPKDARELIDLLHGHGSALQRMMGHRQMFP